VARTGTEDRVGVGWGCSLRLAFILWSALYVLQGFRRVSAVVGEVPARTRSTISDRSSSLIATIMTIMARVHLLFTEKTKRHSRAAGLGQDVYRGSMHQRKTNSGSTKK
jgi:hypothetical protein